jgi:hypothetical protein
MDCRSKRMPKAVPDDVRRLAGIACFDEVGQHAGAVFNFEIGRDDKRTESAALIFASISAL